MVASKKGSSGAKAGSSKKAAAGGGQGLNRAVTPSSDLAAVIGDKARPRTEITKNVWDYIKANGLQDQSNKRMINADDKLKKVFGGKKQVSMFEMTKLISNHLK